MLLFYRFAGSSVGWGNFNFIMIIKYWIIKLLHVDKLVSKFPENLKICFPCAEMFFFQLLLQQ